MIKTMGLFLLALLKIFGWVLLVLLLVLFAAFLLLVFVPVRYDVLASNEKSIAPAKANPVENLRLRIKVTWLLHFIHVSVIYGKEGLQTSVRAAGIDLIKLLARLRRRSRQIAEPEDKEDSQAFDPAQTKDPVDRTDPSKQINVPDQTDPFEREKEAAYIKDDGTFQDPNRTDEHNPVQEPTQIDENDPIQEPTRTDGNDPIQDAVQIDGNDSENKQKQKQKKKQQKKRKRTKKRTKQNIKRKSKNTSRQSFRSKAQQEADAAPHAQQESAPKEGLFQRMRRVYQKVRQEVNDEANRHAISSLFSELLKLLRSYKPRKLRADVSFSLADPAWTGKVTGILSIMPWIYRYPCRIIPDFTADQAYIEGEVQARGKVTVGVFLLSLLRLVRDKQFMKVVRRLLKRGGA
jgi:hypothetical protein